MMKEVIMKTPLTSKEINLYSLYGFTTMIGIIVPMNYIMIFMTDHLLIEAALVGSILGIARIIDFVIGFTAGGIIEKVHMKWGKYRSWVVVMRWVVWAGCTLMFVNTSTLPLGIKAVISIIGYLGLHGSMDFLAVSQYGILAQMAGPSIDDRNRLSIKNGQYFAAGNIAVSLAALPAILFLTYYVGPATAYLLVSSAFAAVFVIGSTILLKVSKPYDTEEMRKLAPGAPKITAGDMIKSIFTNGQLLVIILTQIIYTTGMMGMSMIMAYYFMYVLGNYALMTVGMTATTIFALFGSVLGPKIGLKLGRKKAIVVGLFCAAVSSTCMIFFGKISLVVYIIISCVTSFATYLYMGFGINYILDAGEYGFYKTGKDNRAVAMSMSNMPMKIALALGGVIAGFGLSAIGYVPGATQSATFMNNFMYLFGGIPAICYLVGSLVMLLGYKITEEDALKYASENAARVAAMKEGGNA